MQPSEILFREGCLVKVISDKPPFKSRIIATKPDKDFTSALYYLNLKCECKEDIIKLTKEELNWIYKIITSQGLTTERNINDLQQMMYNQTKLKGLKSLINRLDDKALELTELAIKLKKMQDQL